jgi:hypothetical protein
LYKGKFDDEMGLLSDPVYNRCIHHNQGTISCEALEEIPAEIHLSSNDHSVPLPGQGNAVVFEPGRKHGPLPHPGPELKPE